LKQIAVPITNYNVDVSNNQVYFTEKLIFTRRTISLTPGYYTAADLITELQTQMNAISAGYATYTVSQPGLNQHLVISSTQIFQLRFGTNSLNSAASALGFKNVDTPLGTTTATADSVPNLSLPLSFNIGVNGMTGVRDSTGSNSTLVIPITDNSLSICVYECPAHFQQHLIFESPCKTLFITVKDDDGNFMNLTADWYFILEKC
jgi:hypothetical protein